MIEVSYRIEAGEFGTVRLVQYGRCDGDDTTVETVEKGCTRVYELIQWPNAAGITLKALDGTTPAVVDIKPPTIGRTYKCVKISGRVNPLAPVQEGGSFQGKTVLEYEVVWQQVGALS
jgi:hypothetical protein